MNHSRQESSLLESLMNTCTKMGVILLVLAVCYVCLCLNPSKQKDFWAKGLYIGGTREVRERSDVFIVSHLDLATFSSSFRNKLPSAFQADFTMLENPYMKTLT